MKCNNCLHPSMKASTTTTDSPAFDLESIRGCREFFAILKQELINDRRYATLEEAKADLFE
jgi:hypothetical protein